MTKTNAMRILEVAKIEYTPYEYVPDDNDLTGVHIAKQIGLNPDFVFKTLVARGDKCGLSVFCIPCAMELDLKKCARVTGDKKIELLPVKELLSNTGYIRGGCSPIGMKKQYPTYIDETCQLFDKITVSAGIKGCQLLLEPEKLIALIGMTVADLTVA
ncbi:MAG: Cys-tRNA(Pro) deacylase [Clostridia bacterium]|nr:Cys-tRNA(Pro) deacylase [Clostridia bacterium]